MRILLLSMPDSFEHTPALAIRMPNGALASLAGNVDPHHEVSVVDLVLAQDRVHETVTRLVQERQPDLVGLSVMTFQRRTALRLIRLVGALAPDARLVVGGYDPSLAIEAYEDPALRIDFVIRGEGELTFRALVRALERGHGGLADIEGLSWHDGQRFRHNPDRHVSPLAAETIRPPNRAARVLGGYTFMGRGIDVVETSRGCTYDCSFCAIIEMRGRNFHTFPIPRVLADLRDARARGAEVIFFVDDNLTLDVRRFAALCQAIIDAGLNDGELMVQAMTSSLAQHGAELAPLMKRAGFRYVFLGIENILDDDLEFLKARAKNTTRGRGRRGDNATVAAIEHIHRHGMYVVGGLIVGNPDDTRESVLANLAFARRYVDWPYIQHPTPYPRTPMAKEFQARGLIVNERLEEWDGTSAVVKTAHLAAEEVEFLRWRAERWMKLRHLPRASMHYPWFALRHWRGMVAHTFRGTTWRSVVGLEDARTTFRRYKALRAREREYLGAACDSA